MAYVLFFFFSSRRRHTRFDCDWSSDVCSSDLVVEHDQVLGRGEDLGRIDGHGLVQLQRVAGAPEVVVGQQQLVDGRVDLDGALQVQQVQAPARHVLKAQGRVAQHGEVGLGHGLQFLACGAQGVVQADDEVEQVQVVPEEQVVLDVVDAVRLQRCGGHGRGRIGRDKGQDRKSVV